MYSGLGLVGVRPECLGFDPNGWDKHASPREVTPHEKTQFHEWGLRFAAPRHQQPEEGADETVVEKPCKKTKFR